MPYHVGPCSSMSLRIHVLPGSIKPSPSRPVSPRNQNPISPPSPPVSGCCGSYWGWWGAIRREGWRRQCLKCWHWRSALPANFGSSSLFKANTSLILASRFSSRNWKWFYNFISQPVQREYTCRRAIWIQCHSVLEFHRCSLWTPWWQHLMRLARRHGLIITSTTST